MRRRFAVTLPAQQPARQPAQPKLTPPVLTQVTQDGYPKLIAAHKGRVVLVNFWATYCIPCRTEIPEMVKLADRLRARGLDFVSISADEPEQEPQARKFIVAAKVPGPLYIKSADDDDKFAAAIHPRWDGRCPRPSSTTAPAKESAPLSARSPEESRIRHREVPVVGQVFDLPSRDGGYAALDPTPNFAAARAKVLSNVHKRQPESSAEARRCASIQPSPRPRNLRRSINCKTSACAAIFAAGKESK